MVPNGASDCASRSETGAGPPVFDTPRDVTTRCVTANRGSRSTPRLTKVEAQDARGSKKSTASRFIVASTTLVTSSAMLVPSMCALTRSSVAPALVGTCTSVDRTSTVSPSSSTNCWSTRTAPTRASTLSRRPRAPLTIIVATTGIRAFNEDVAGASTVTNSHEWSLVRWLNHHERDGRALVRQPVTHKHGAGSRRHGTSHHGEVSRQGAFDSLYYRGITPRIRDEHRNQRTTRARRGQGRIDDGHDRDGESHHS